MRDHRTLGLALAAVGLLLGGCDIPGTAAWAPELDDVNAIVDDTDLTVQEQRAQLLDMGLSPLVINALLRSERTGNQFGGDLRSAYEKVTGGALQSLTPDELQIYGDAAEDVTTASDDFAFSDTEAQATLTLFAEQDINDTADLLAFLDDPAAVAGTPADVPLDMVEALLVDFDSDLLLPELP